MRIVSDESKRLVTFADRRPSQCLHGLALRCGYRVGELSDALGYSGRYVQEVFVRDLGVPPKRWLREERMAVASRLLRTGMRPGEVADKIGFAAGNGFRREFQMMHGMPPGEYVRRMMCGESGAARASGG